MFRRIKKRFLIQMLNSLDTEGLRRLSERKALDAFHQAAAKVPAYRQFLKENNILPSSVSSIEDFHKHVPIIDKDKTFRLYSHEIKKLCLLGEIKDAKTIISSSGHSGCFSYSLNSQKESEKMQEAIDFILNYIFEVSEKKTLLINTLPMGVKIHSSLVTVVDTSVRSDIAISIIKTFAVCYDQIILVGENSFVKKILEDGLEEGLEWRHYKLHLVLGEEILPENLRTYFARILGINPDGAEHQTLIGSSFGVAEFGLNIFYETRELIKIRRLFQRDKKLKERLIGRDPDNLPMLLTYNPLRVFVEESPKQDGLADIVLTNLEENALIPLVRYNIKDEGICVPYEHLKETLSSMGYGNYVPLTKLPLVAIWGRDKILLEEGFYLRPEFVKELLYSDEAIASKITGNFKLSSGKAGLRIEIQAKKSAGRSEGLETLIKNLLLANIPAKTEIILYPYQDFPHGMELSYEKKFQYI